MYRTVMTKTADGQILIVRESFANLKQRREMRKRGSDMPSDCWVVRDRVIAQDFDKVPEKARPWLPTIVSSLDREISNIISDPVKFCFAVILLRSRGFSMRNAIAFVRRVQDVN